MTEEIAKMWADILGGTVMKDVGTFQSVNGEPVTFAHFIETDMGYRLNTPRECFRAAIVLSHEGGL